MRSESTASSGRPGRGSGWSTRTAATSSPGEGVERLALKTDWGNREGVERFQHELQRIGVLGALRRAGAEPGDEVRIGDTVFDFQ